MDTKSVNGELASVWEGYYCELEGDTALKDRNFFKLEVEAIRDQVLLALGTMPAAARKHARILELGSGTGILAQFLLDAIEKKFGDRPEYHGVDFSQEACRRADARKIAGARFYSEDFERFARQCAGQFDLIVTQRSLMALMTREAQDSLLTQLRSRLKEGGSAIFSEGFSSGIDEVNRLRKILGVTDGFESVWHSRYLDDGQLEHYFPQSQYFDFGSTYWMLTRVVYPYFEKPKHNTPLHDFAAQLGTVGNYCPIRLFVSRT